MLQIDPGEVGRNMRAVRVSKNVGRGRLAEESDVALQSIRNYERGRNFPGLVNLICLSSALGVSMDEYTGMKGRYNIPQ